jgi:D-glycero-D-manno-heptose 1,7-bisphosphate phosphatase
MNEAVFLDRDGTIIVDSGYLTDPNEVSLMAGAAQGLRELHEADIPLVVISNQSGLGRGLISEAEAAMVHDRFVELLDANGIGLAGVYYCPHDPLDRCSCRKPSTGMFLKARDDLGLDLANSVMIGDRVTDVEAGRAAGCRTVLLAASCVQDPRAWRVVSDLGSAAREILGKAT